ncbi:hypothetical protein C5167_023842 [Papaver somniferum]|uniref:Uncharacterized protein n=1 Tax=Papaver somniferum TaxID=3469 RepID=A0A4Y7JQY8_PAPSO|nr:hypothetical protein C5167_023842 [Papaver somniferum]
MESFLNLINLPTYVSSYELTELINSHASRNLSNRSKKNTYEIFVGARHIPRQSNIHPRVMSCKGMYQRT